MACLTSLKNTHTNAHKVKMGYSLVLTDAIFNFNHHWIAKSVYSVRILPVSEFKRVYWLDFFGMNPKNANSDIICTH